MTTCLPRELTTDKHVILPVLWAESHPMRTDRASRFGAGLPGRAACMPRQNGLARGSSPWISGALPHAITAPDRGMRAPVAGHSR
jgi:hypothetical protein